IAYVEEQQRLDSVDVGTAVAVELVLDDVQKPAMQPLDQLKRFHVKRPDRFTAIVGNGSGLRRRTRIDHCLASRLSPGDCLFLTLIATLSNASKIRLKRQD